MVPTMSESMTETLPAGMMPALMKTEAGVGHFGLGMVAIPVAKPGQVIVEVAAAGVCGTDLHIIDDVYGSIPPVVLGHEVSGTVIELGEGVDATWLGARVACESHHQVCTCDYCRDGRRNLCDNKTSMGSFVNGGFAPRLAIPITLVHRIPDHVSLEGAAMLEPVASVCNVMFDPGVITAGDRVLVTGPGPVGLIAAQIARAQGGIVVVTGLPSDAARLAIARELGFEAIDAPTDRLFDVVVECSGSADGARAALTAAKKGGRYLAVGLYGKDVTIPFDLVLYKELVVSSGFAATPKSWLRALRLLELGSIELKPLISGSEPLERWEAVLQSLRAGETMKVLFDPRLAG